ncbi:hypothetical protein VV01_14015 [Luteipulveratus halotolerans]|uniref:Uncharacterized protein n=1 Tax=Luteipulveratus halotolerans TaxID=1631356 RepID=A0A0L6CJP4_9MICO|nr:hypothetical protein VV01_14015 [Luteipulveratus halotolerans]
MSLVDGGGGLDAGRRTRERAGRTGVRRTSYVDIWTTASITDPARAASLAEATPTIVRRPRARTQISPVPLVE